MVEVTLGIRIIISKDDSEEDADVVELRGVIDIF